MAYPRLLNLDEDTETRLKQHLDQILLQSEAERGPWMQDLIQYQEDYWAKPKQERRKFPFDGAANIIIPLTAIVFETVHARTMTQAFGLDQIVSVKATSPQWTEAATPFERFYNHTLKHQAKFKERIEPSIIEIEKLGTGVGYADYEHVIRFGVREVEGVEVEFPVTVRRGLTFHSVPLSRWVFPYTASCIEDAPWIGQEHERAPYELYQSELGGLFYEGTTDALKFYNANLASTGSRYKQNQESLESRKPYDPANDNITWYEIWLPFAVDGEDTEPKEIVVHYQRESRMIMAARYNWYSDLRRKYRSGVYFPVEHRIMGLGIAKQNSEFQKEVTTQHRQRLDNATLANMRMIKVSKMSGYGPGEPVFPGKMWFLDDLSQVETFQLGEIYPSAYNNEQQTLIYSQQRTGVNEVILGMPQVGTPGTATSDLARIQEGNKKFDYTYGNIKTFMDSLLLDGASCIQQFGPSNVTYQEHLENGQIVEQMLMLPPDLIRDGLVMEIGSAGQKDNKLLDRQNWQQVAALMQQYYTSIMQIAAQLGDQQMLQMISQKALSASTEAMKQILESYDLNHVDRLVMMELMNGIGNPAVPGGNQGVGGPQSAGGMADPNQIMQLLSAGGAQGGPSV